MSKLKYLVLGSIYLCLFCLISCHKESYPPISINGIYGNKYESLNMSWFPEDTIKYSFIIQGGDGIYSATCNKPDIVQVNMISTTEMQVQPLALGDAVIMVSDQSSNVATMQVRIDYRKLEIKITETDVTITGNLAGEETEAIRNEAFQTIPVKAGGGYRLIFTEENKGTAIIYPELFDNNGIDGSFEWASITMFSQYGEEMNIPVIYITINDEKRTFIMSYYQSYVLREDLTSKFKVKYPNIEMLYTSQILHGWYN